MPIRRAYFNVAFGQIHGRIAGPTQPENRHCPVVCLHQSPMSSWVFEPILDRLGADRIVYALDTPGFGESDLPPAEPTVEDYAAAIGQVLESLGHERFDVLGYHTGALIATELALTRAPLIRSMVLIGLAVFEPAEIAAFEAQPWPRPISEDGAHLQTEWQRSVQWAGPGMTLSMIAKSFAAKLHAGETAWWGAQAAYRYAMAEKLPQVKQNILALGPKDDLWEISPRAQALIQNGHFERLPDLGFGLFETAPDAITQRLREHFDQ